jgi:hypothetical protein
MLDDTQSAFAAEMQAKPHLRPSGIRRGELDTMSGVGAAFLARKIEAFWAASGFEVKVDIVPFVAGNGTNYALRSNRQAGLPRAPVTGGSALNRARCAASTAPAGSHPGSRIALAGARMRGFFSAHCAAWDRSKATNPLESCPRSRSHASGKERY